MTPNPLMKNHLWFLAGKFMLCCPHNPPEGLKLALRGDGEQSRWSRSRLKKRVETGGKIYSVAIPPRWRRDRLLVDCFGRCPRNYGATGAKREAADLSTRATASILKPIENVILPLVLSKLSSERCHLLLYSELCPVDPDQAA